MNQFIDIATVIIIVSIVWSCAVKGFVRSFIELIGYVASLIVAWIFSVSLGNWIYENMLKTVLYNAVSSYVGTLTGAAQQSFSKMLSDYHLDANMINQAGVLGAAKSGNGAVNNAIMSGIVAPLGGIISRGIAFIVIFLICLTIVGIIAHAGDIINKLPVIHGINMLGGAAIGIVKAVLVLFVLCTIIVVLLPVFAMQKDPLFTNTTLNNTYVFKYFYQANPVKDILLKN